MTARIKRAPSVVLVMAVLMSWAQLGAQVASQSVSPKKGVLEVLARFEKLASSGLSGTPDEVRHPEKYSRARVDSVLDGLERIALTADPQFIGSSAAASLTLAGSTNLGPPGAFDRALRVYHRSSQRLIRTMILQNIPELKNRSPAIVFLKSVATQAPTSRDFEREPYTAAVSLTMMGAEGRAALTDLRDRKALRDGRTIGFVNWFLSTQQ